MHLEEKYCGYEIHCGANRVRRPDHGGRVQWEAAVMLVHLPSGSARLMFVKGERFDTESTANSVALGFAMKWIDEHLATGDAGASPVG